MAQFVTHIQPTLMEASQGHAPHYHHHHGGTHMAHLPHSGHNLPSPPTAHHNQPHHNHQQLHGKQAKTHRHHSGGSSGGSAEHPYYPHHYPPPNDHKHHGAKQNSVSYMLVVFSFSSLLICSGCFGCLVRIWTPLCGGCAVDVLFRIVWGRRILYNQRHHHI